MKPTSIVTLFLLLFSNILVSQEPNPVISKSARTDFLIDAEPFVARVTGCELKMGQPVSIQAISADTNEIVLENGLIKRTWRIAPNGACTGFDNLMTGQSMLRSVRPEARLTIENVEYQVGGLVGQPNQAFLKPDWLDQMTDHPDSMKLISITVDQPRERIQWKRRRHAAPETKWPPKGIYLRMDYRSALAGIDVSIHYEMYDGIPAMAKWITVQNQSENSITINRFRAEEIAAVEQANWVELQDGVIFPKPDYLHVETDFAFGGFNYQNANRHAVHWKSDPEFKTQVNYQLKTPCLLTVEPTFGPEQDVLPGQTFESFTTFELVYDSSDRERRGLTLRKMYRTLAPWVTENPITHHLLSSDPDVVRAAIDNAAAVGFEAVILSFGSGFNMESTDSEYLKKWTQVAGYAEQKGIELGAYSLFSSRSVGGGNDVVSPEGMKPKFGKAPAATSEWGVDYFGKLKQFFDSTGFDQFENDGPYPGDLDTTERLPLQKGGDDSRWAQWKVVVTLYRHLRAIGVYINQPDYYFMNGGNKTGMGYREVNWSLPRAQQVIHTRQNIYDGTWTKTPSMGWMHVPLAQYHGGGAAATIEPLNEHLDHYERMLRSNLGMGVQAHYRGPRLFDTEETKLRVASVVEWFKTHRDILESDLIHGRRADARDIDWVLHVNPLLETKGMLCVWNPLDEPIKKRISVNLYYTGLSDVARISEGDASFREYKLNRDYLVEIEVEIPANQMKWFLVK